MWWILLIVGLVACLGVAEWRSWHKPLGSRFHDLHEKAQDVDRYLTGGHDIGSGSPR